MEIIQEKYSKNRESTVKTEIYTQRIGINEYLPDTASEDYFVMIFFLQFTYNQLIQATG